MVEVKPVLRRLKLPHACNPERLAIAVVNVLQNKFPIVVERVVGIDDDRIA
jgi:hypothetical protein